MYLTDCNYPRGIIYYTMEDFRKIILLMTIFSFMSVGWGQSYTENITQEYINISDNEVMIISNHEMEGYTYSDTTYISVSILLPPCDDGYTEIGGECYYQSDLDVLQQFIDNSQEGDNPPPSDLSLIELGEQVWEDGRLVIFQNHQGHPFVLSGEFPEIIGNITSLYHLDLSFQQLTGEIPSDIGNLVDLERLLLGDNQLQGEISESICNLENLNVLHLGLNQLSGVLPECIFDLQNLTSLGLGGNQLSGIISPEIGNLNLGMGSVSDKLDLSGNQFTGNIPTSIGNFVYLSTIKLSSNELIGEIPESFGNLYSLVDLKLNNNQLSGDIPQNICNLNVFWLPPISFDISNNQFCPPYPDCGEGPITSEEQQDTSECEEPDAQIGDECVMQDGLIGFYDCELCCWDEWIIENWLGDGWCDYLGGCGFEGPLFNCPELGYDCGDCTEDWDGTDPSGLCSNDCLFPGDVNSDSILNILDIVSMITLILDGEYDECGDVNSDGYLNILDVVTFVNIILSIP